MEQNSLIDVQYANEEVRDSILGYIVNRIKGKRKKHTREDIISRAVEVRVKGERFSCPTCSSNMFTYTKSGFIKCNNCGKWYEVEKGE